MTVSELIIESINNRKTYRKEVAAKMGWTETAFSNKLRRNSINGDDLIKIMDILGYDIRFVDKGMGLPTKKMYQKSTKGIVVSLNDDEFDSKQSLRLCHKGKVVSTLYELYLSSDGQFYSVTTTENEGVTVLRCSKEQAREIYIHCSESEVDSKFPV